MTPAEDMAWMKQLILNQVDLVVQGMECNDPEQLLQSCKAIVRRTIGHMDVSHALGMYYHIVAQAANQETHVSGTDRLQHVYDHFNCWIELELAKRYA